MIRKRFAINYFTVQLPFNLWYDGGQWRSRIFAQFAAWTWPASEPQSIRITAYRRIVDGKAPPKKAWLDHR